MGILRADKITGLGGANAIKGSVLFSEKQYFKIDNHEDFQFGTGEWTIEYWWNGHPNGGYNSVITTMITSNESGTWRVGHTFSGNNRIYFARGTGSGFTDVTFDVDVNDNKWHHIAFVRSSGTIIPFVDGVDKTATKATGSVSDGNSMTTTNPVLIGFNDRDNNYLHGHVSNLRVIKGTALYTSNFTPPTGELSKLSGTSLLCFQSPSDILQEETGKILQPYRDGATAGDQAGLNSTYAVATRFTPNTPVGFSTTTDVGSQYGATFDGFTVFATSTYMVPPGGNTRERNRGRGVVSGGETPSRVNTITFTHIQSSGNFQDFGDLIGGGAGETKGVGSSTRGVFFTNHGGSSGQAEDLEFITFANQSNGTDFGDLDNDHPMRGSAGNETRGIFAGGYKLSLKDQIEFITIATIGNGTDFGNLTGTRNAVAGLASPTRALFGGGSSPTNVDNIDVITIATTGDASDFGDLTRSGKEMGGVASNTRGVFAGARINPSTASNVIDFVTIASAGNAIDFGDLTQIVAAPASITDSVRGLFAGGYTPSPSFSRFNSIDFINIATTGNASDFGDLTYAQNYAGGCSDSHGGL